MGKETKPRNITIAIILAMAIIFGVGTFGTGLLTAYNIQTPNESIADLQIVGEINEFTNQLKTVAQKTQTVTGIQPLDSLISSTLSSIALIFEMPDFFITFTAAIATLLKIPIYFITLIQAAILFILVITLIKAITKGDL